VGGRLLSSGQEGGSRGNALGRKKRDSAVVWAREGGKKENKTRRIGRIRRVEGLFVSIAMQREEIVLADHGSGEKRRRSEPRSILSRVSRGKNVSLRELSHQDRKKGGERERNARLHSVRKEKKKKESAAPR